MITFIYKDKKDLQLDIELGNFQTSVLKYFEELESIYETPLEQYITNAEYGLFYHFDAQVSEFYIKEEEIKNPNSIINAFIKINGDRKEIATILHKHIEQLYYYFLTLSVEQKEKLHLSNLAFGDRENSLKEIINYCREQLKNMDNKNNG